MSGYPPDEEPDWIDYTLAVVIYGVPLIVMLRFIAGTVLWFLREH